MTTTPGAIAVVIPAYNEAPTIAAVVGEVRARLACQVIVVDDASSDGTAERALAAGATVLPLVAQLGAWGATQTGIRLAVRRGCRAVVTMDADGQHKAEAIPALLEPVLQGQADVAIGACTARGSFARRLAWRFFRALTGLSIADLTSGFRAYSGEAMAILASREATLLEYQDIGVLTRLRAAGLRLREVEVAMAPRITGHSRVFSSWLAVFYYLVYTGVLCISKRELPPVRSKRPRSVASA